MIKIVGFDLDGVLADEDFDWQVWNQVIPEKYAEKNNLSLEEGKRYVYAEYYKAQHIEQINEWFDINYWLKRFGLDFDEVIKDMPDCVYDDVLETLSRLSKKYELVLITNSIGFFRESKIKNIKKYFKKVITPAETGRLGKSNPDFWRKTLQDLNIEAEEMVYVGDRPLTDYDAPMKAGIKAVLMDRTTGKGKGFLHNMKQFEEWIDSLLTRQE